MEMLQVIVPSGEDLRADRIMKNENVVKNSEHERTDQNEKYSLRVKPEFILHQRASSLPPLRVLAVTSATSHEESLLNNKERHGKKKRGMSRKRPHSKVDESTKLCLSVIRGNDCVFGDRCRFSHDLSAYMATRPADIAEVESGCPNFRLYGHCVYGPMCRLGGSHIDKNGKNMTAEIRPNSSPAAVINILPKDLQEQLRKKKFPFKCKVHYEEKNNRKSEQTMMDGNKVSNINVAEPILEKNGDHPNLLLDCFRHINASEDASENNLANTLNEMATDEKLRLGGNIDEVIAPEKGETLIENEQKKINALTAPVSTNDCERAEGLKIEVTDAMTSSFTTPFPDKEIKLVDFSNKVYVAPLTTVGNLPFRRIMKQFGADITCGEMAVATNLLQGQPSEWALLKRHRDEDIFGIQIAAGFADQATRCCEVLENHASMDFVDLNLGCPLDLICEKGCGAALMMRDKRLEAAVKGMTQTLSCSVTLKMRTGWDMSKPFAHKLVSKIHTWDVNGQIAAIMVHGRSRLQRYSNCADWDYIRQVAAVGATPSCLDRSRIPIIGNGDIFSYTDYEINVLSQFEEGKDDGIALSSCAMLARGALIKPWLPLEIKERRNFDISASERLDILKNFVRFGLEHWGSDQQGVNNCRRFLLEWLSFLHRYVPVGLLEVIPQQMNQRLPSHMCGRNDLETLFLSDNCLDWIKISELLLGPVEDGFYFEPKHKAKSYQGEG